MSRFGQSFSRTTLGISDRKKEINSLLGFLKSGLEEEPLNDGEQHAESKGGGKEKESKYNCDQCGREYVLERNLKKHLSDKHPNVSSRESSSNSSENVAQQHTALNEEFSRIDQFQLNLCTQQAFSNNNKTNDSITYEVSNIRSSRTDEAVHKFNTLCDDNNEQIDARSAKDTIESGKQTSNGNYRNLRKRSPVKKVPKNSRKATLESEDSSDDDDVQVVDQQKHKQQSPEHSSSSDVTLKQNCVQNSVPDTRPSRDTNTEQLPEQNCGNGPVTIGETAGNRDTVAKFVAAVDKSTSPIRKEDSVLRNVHCLEQNIAATESAANRNELNESEIDSRIRVRNSTDDKYMVKMKEEMSDLLKQFKEQLAILAKYSSDKELFLLNQSKQVQVPTSPRRSTRTVNTQTTVKMHHKSVSASSEFASTECQTCQVVFENRETSTVGQKWGCDVELQVASETVDCETMTDWQEEEEANMKAVNSEIRTSVDPPPEKKTDEVGVDERFPTLTQQFMGDCAPVYLVEMEREQELNECVFNESFFMDSLRTNTGGGGGQHIASTQQNSPTFSSSKGSATEQPPEQAAEQVVYDISFLQSQNEPPQPTEVRSESQSSSPSSKTNTKQSALKKFKRQVSAMNISTTGSTMRKIPSKSRKRTHVSDSSSSNDSGGKRGKVSVLEEGKLKNVDEIGCSLDLDLLDQDKKKEERQEPDLELLEKEPAKVGNTGEVASLGDSVFASSLLLLDDEDTNNDIIEQDKVPSPSKNRNHATVSCEKKEEVSSNKGIEVAAVNNTEGADCVEVECDGGMRTQVTTKELTSQTGKVVRNQTPYERGNGELGEEQDEAGEKILSSTSKRKRKQQQQKVSNDAEVLCETLEGVIVAISSLDSSEVSVVRKTCVRLGGHFRKELTEKTTHLVIRKADVGKGERVVQRTQKYLEAIARGIWIVEYEWMEECARLGGRVTEEKYEILGETICGIEHRGPTRARTRVQTSGGSGGGLLCKCAVHCPAEFIDMGVEVVERLVKSAGGTWVTNRLKFNQQDSVVRRRVLLVDCELSSAVKKIADECELPLISREWLLDSLCQARLLSRKDYIVYSSSTTQQNQTDLERTLSNA